jgi:acetylornithine deacetylase/succinyl-diaminopimelate desuccinylase-like protein
MEEVKDYIEKYKESILKELFDLIRIPSVSAEKSNNNAMNKDGRLCMLKKLSIKHYQLLWYTDIMMCSRLNP